MGDDPIGRPCAEDAAEAAEERGRLAEAEARRYLEKPEDRTVPLLRIVLEANESPSQHRLFVYRDDELLGQLPAMNADVQVQPGEVAMLTFGLRVSKNAQVKSVASS